MWIISALFSLALALDPGNGAGISVIEQAQALALKKNRTEACAVLKRALATSSAPAARAKLKEALQQISRVPFTDKGQRNFEGGQAVLFENPELALTQFKDALTLEDGNVAVRLGLARVYVIRNDLDAARTELKLARELNPYDSEVALLDARAMVGQKNFELSRERLKGVPAADRWQEAFASYLQAQDYLQQGQGARAAEILNRVIGEAPKFPEAHYYLARADRPRAAESHLRHYVGLCRTLTARDRRTFALEPRLCANQKEAEDELAKKSVDM